MPQDSLSPDGYRPIPDDNNEVMITVDAGQESPLYLIEFSFWNARVGSEIEIVVRNDSDGVVEVRDVRALL